MHVCAGDIRYISGGTASFAKRRGDFLESYDKAHELARQIRDSEMYRTYVAAREVAMEDATNAALLKEYKRLQTTLQMRAMGAGGMEGEEVQRFQQLSTLLYMHPDVAAYLMAELRMQKMMADIFQILTDAADLQIELPGM